MADIELVIQADKQELTHLRCFFKCEPDEYVGRFVNFIHFTGFNPMSPCRKELPLIRALEEKLVEDVVESNDPTARIEVNLKTRH